MGDRDEVQQRILAHMSAMRRQLEGIRNHPEAKRGLLRCAALHATRAATLSREISGAEAEVQPAPALFAVSGCLADEAKAVGEDATAAAPSPMRATQAGATKRA